MSVAFAGFTELPDRCERVSCHGAPLPDAPQQEIVLHVRAPLPDAPQQNTHTLTLSALVRRPRSLRSRRDLYGRAPLPDAPPQSHLAIASGGMRLSLHQRAIPRLIIQLIYNTNSFR